MAHERRRAALAALCVLAIALAATLFPASGFGSQPAGVGVGDGPDGSDAPVGGEIGPDDPESTSTPDPQETSPATPTTPDESSEDSSDAPTEQTPTTTANGTAGQSTDSDGGSLRNLLGVVGFAAIGLVGFLSLVGFWTGALAVGTSAAGPLPVTIVVRDTPIGELAGSIPTRTMALVVGLSASVPRLLDDAATLTNEVSHSFGTVLGGLARGSAEAFRVGVRGLGVTVAAIPRALAGLGAGAGVLGSFGKVGVPSFGRGGSDRSDGSDNRRGAAGATEPEETGPPSVEEAWQTMRDRVPVRNRDARTPGEVARAAARRGYPDDAVRRLTDAFREVRYGDLPRDDRTDSARSALDRLRDHWRDDE